jgi:hypothetical protein
MRSIEPNPPVLFFHALLLVPLLCSGQLRNASVHIQSIETDLKV